MEQALSGSTGIGSHWADFTKSDFSIIDRRDRRTRSRIRANWPKRNCRNFDLPSASDSTHPWTIVAFIQQVRDWNLDSSCSRKDHGSCAFLPPDAKALLMDN